MCWLCVPLRLLSTEASRMLRRRRSEVACSGEESGNLSHYARVLQHVLEPGLEPGPWGSVANAFYNMPLCSSSWCFENAKASYRTHRT